MCNCDSGRDGVDEGYNTHAQLLPVMQLYVGGTNEYSSTNITIGPLKCARRRKRTFYSLKRVNFQKSTKLLRLWTEIKIWSVRRRSVWPPFLTFICKFGSRIRKWPFLHGSLQMANAGIRFLWEVYYADVFIFKISLLEGRLVGQIVNAGRTHEIVSDFAINDNEWHQIYWEVDPQTSKLSIDKREKIVSAFYVLPDTFTYFFGDYLSICLTTQIFRLTYWSWQRWIRRTVKRNLSMRTRNPACSTCA
jgi:hypothetical protein